MSGTVDFFDSNASYFTLDNIEMTGLNTSGAVSHSYVDAYGPNQEYEHLYVHGWSHAASGDSDDAAVFVCNGGYDTTGQSYHDNVIDGSDTTKDMIVAFTGSCPSVYNNYVNHVSNGMEASADLVHDNTFLTIDASFMPGAHQNSLFQFGPAQATTLFVYNNLIIQGPACGGGCVKLWLNGNESNTATMYAFNNVIFNGTPGNNLNVAGHNASPYGTFYYFNNTEECGSDSDASGCGGGICTGSQCGPTGTITWDNNHWILASSFDYCYYPGFTCSKGSGELQQTVSVASGQGYTSGSNYGFQPTLGSGPTVGKGINHQAYCTAIGGLNASAGTACQNDTSYGVAVVNHTVTGPARAVTQRPASGAWDIGAYQFTPAGCVFTPTSIGPYTAGQPVSQQFTASNCTTSTFTISSGSLSSSGLTLSSAGLLSGTAQAGSFSFTVAYGAANDPISLTVDTAPIITTSSLSAGQIGAPYSQLLSTSGGTGAILCAVTTGSLPTGLTLNGCAISGTPTTASTYSFSVAPIDANGVTGTTRALSILINLPTSSTPLILHTTFCGPDLTWPGTCTLSAPTTAGSRLVLVYSSYNSAGSTPVMNSITDGGDTFSQLANARSTNTNSATSWNDIWSANGVAAGVTALTITPSTTQTGDVYVWEVQYAPNVMGCSSMSSQAAVATAVGAPMLAGVGAILLSHLHPAPGGNPTAVAAPFTTDIISDQMAYAQYTPSSQATFAPQWTQTAATFATATCAFSASGTALNPPSSLTTITQ